MIKKILPIIFIFLVSMFFNACEIFEKKQEIDKTAFYLSMGHRESEIVPFIGFYEITEKEAESLNHYKFDYDKKGKLISVEYKKGNKLLAFDPALTYSIPSARVVFSYSENKEIRHFFDFNSMPTIIQTEVYKQIAYYNNEGKITSIENYTREGDPGFDEFNTYKYEWNYLENNTAIEKRFDINNNPVSFIENEQVFESQIKLNNQNQVIEFTYLGEPQTKPSIEKLIYTNGALSTREAYNAELNKTLFEPDVFAYQYVYDTLVQLINTYFTDTTGIITKTKIRNFAQTKLDYNENGELITINYLDEESNLVVPYGQKYSTIRRNFTGRNFIESEFYFDTDNKPVVGKKGYHKLIRDFDEWGNILRLYEYDVNNKVIRYQSEKLPKYLN